MSREKTVVYEQDQDGNFVQFNALSERNKEIIDVLQTAFDTLKAEKEACRVMKSKEKVGARFAMQLDNVLRSYGIMSAEEVANITYEQIEGNFNAFRDLLAHYNLTFEIVPNKQLFYGFARINQRIYAQLENSKDEDIKDLMASINDYFLFQGFNFTENGNADSKATYNRMSAHGVGHNMVKASEQQIIDKLDIPTASQMEKDLYAILGNEKGQLKS